MVGIIYDGYFWDAYDGYLRGNIKDTGIEWIGEKFMEAHVASYIMGV